MLIKLGYACISKTLEGITPSTPFTYTEYLKYHNLTKLNNIIESNLKDLNELINYNIKNNIHFFRISSKLVPLATRIDVIFDYKIKFEKYYNSIGKKIADSNMRCNFHPDQFCVLNSTKQEVLDNTFEILKYHYKILEYLNIKNKVIVLHIGSSVFGKENSKKRFINNFKKLPIDIQKSIAIENDDKVFNIKDCIDIYNEIKTPIVLDYHHHICNNDGININFYIKTILDSWGNITPKMHFSSPKNKTKKDFRSHHDFINSDSFINFIDLIKVYNKDVDIMIEAKAKDMALFKLIRELKYKTNYEFIDETSFRVL